MKINWKILTALGLIVWAIVWPITSAISVIIVLGALFYVSYASRHYWIRRFRPTDDELIQDEQPVARDSQGRALRSHNYLTDK